jgi:hypothetical protein
MSIIRFTPGVDSSLSSKLTAVSARSITPVANFAARPAADADLLANTHIYTIDTGEYWRWDQPTTTWVRALNTTYQGALVGSGTTVDPLDFDADIAGGRLPSDASTQNDWFWAVEDPTGTPNTKRLSAAEARKSLRIPEHEAIALSDEVTTITTGTAKVTWRAPFALTLTAVRASLATASSSGLVTVDINEAGATILSTKLSIDASEKTSTTAATAAVISDTSIADDAELTFDIDAAGTGAKGLKVTLYFYRT